jgi:hypothetical protein
VRATRKRAHGDVRHVHGDVQPAASGSVRYGGVLDCGMATKLPWMGPWCALCTRRRLLGCERVPPVRLLRQTGP